MGQTWPLRYSTCALRIKIHLLVVSIKTLNWVQQKEKENTRMSMSEILPRECICKIISLTSPKDACRSCAVSRWLRELADSDEVWEGFLPSDCRHLISKSASPNLSSLPAKQLFCHLSHHPILLSDQNMVTQRNFSISFTTNLYIIIIIIIN